MGIMKQMYIEQLERDLNYAVKHNHIDEETAYYLRYSATHDEISEWYSKEALHDEEEAIREVKQSLDKN